MTPQRASALVKRFEEAAAAYAFRGASHPGDREYLTVEYTAARQALLDALTKAVRDKI